LQSHIAPGKESAPSLFSALNMAFGALSFCFRRKKLAKRILCFVAGASGGRGGFGGRGGGRGGRGGDRGGRGGGRGGRT